MLVPIFKKKRREHCRVYKKVKVLEYDMKIGDKVREKRIRESVKVDAMPGRKTTDTLFVVRKMPPNIREKKHKVVYLCSINIEKAFDRVSRTVTKWAMTEKAYQK